MRHILLTEKKNTLIDIVHTIVDTDIKKLYLLLLLTTVLPLQVPVVLPLLSLADPL